MGIESTPLGLALAGVGLVGVSGLVALVVARARRAATLLASAGAMVGCALGLFASVTALGGGQGAEVAAPWRVPGGAILLGMDPLSAFFLAPIFVLGALCALYARAYLGPRPLAAAELNLLVASMALVVLARHALLFLVAWEAMTLLAYLLVTLEHREAEVRRAGWVYLIASHVAVIALVAFFLALGARAEGELAFSALAAADASVATAGVLLGLALVGFGVKAGVVGLHVWLPEAHAAAPSHVSALMSGALVKVGIYGLLRTVLLVDAGAGFGRVLMVLGVAGTLLGIALALQQRDLKRILAYSSVENLGVILLALGLGLWAKDHGNGALAALAFGGGLLHVWNHAAMKGLLFLDAGSILHGTGTRDVERLGGLLRRMPWTGWTMLVGAVAIAALPPLNGFSSEWLLFRALATVGTKGDALSGLAAIGGAAALALAGGLATLCFVRLIGVVLLGTPRSDAPAHAHEPSAAMIGPPLVLAAACVAGALCAPRLVTLQAPLLADLGGVSEAEVAAAADSLVPIVRIDAALPLAMLLGTALFLRQTRRAPRSETWGCGYAAPTPRMQYTGRGFSEFLTARVLPRWMQPRLSGRRPSGTFPTAASFGAEDTDPLTRSAYEPFLVRCGARFARLRFLQQGNVHAYILYILVAAIAGLAWVAFRDGLSR
jgi:formate hydrogenlyase subunit 3/multisubunit Na+/H+ antiporter MnhD subunit